MILQESTGANKYFRHLNYMKYPRLRLAIEHNHKEFVGHMYCQQILRQTWHGNVPWQTAAITFKLIHFLLQMILAPIFAAMIVISDTIKDSQYLFDIKVNQSENRAAIRPLEFFLIFVIDT